MSPGRKCCVRMVLSCFIPLARSYAGDYPVWMIPQFCRSRAHATVFGFRGLHTAFSVCFPSSEALLVLKQVSIHQDVRKGRSHASSRSLNDWKFSAISKTLSPAVLDSFHSVESFEADLEIPRGSICTSFGLSCP